jgi:hypothetical protein
MRRVNHQQRPGRRRTTDNQAESYISRWRMQIGQHHHFGLHLANYANEAAYREDT